jgi:uncharacterized membrane protein
MGERGDKDQLEQLEAWWAFLSRVLAFLLGAVILMHQVLFARLSLIEMAISAALMGPAVASAVAQILVAVRGGVQR